MYAEIKHHIGTSFCPSSLEETMRTGDNSDHDVVATIRVMRQTCEGVGAPEVFGYPIEVGAAQQAGPPSSGTITCGCSSIIDVGAFHGAGGGSGSGTLAASYVRTYLVDMGGGLLRRRQHV